MPYRIDFARSVRAQIEALTAGQRKALLHAVEQHLTHEPMAESRNRKCLRPNSRMKTIELSTATRPLAEYANEIGDEMVVLTNHHKLAAAIVSLKHINRESLALSTSAEFMEAIEQARREIAAGDTITLEEMKRAVLP